MKTKITKDFFKSITHIGFLSSLLPNTVVWNPIVARLPHPHSNVELFESDSHTQIELTYLLSDQNLLAQGEKIKSQPQTVYLLNEATGDTYYTHSLLNLKNNLVCDHQMSGIEFSALLSTHAHTQTSPSTQFLFQPSMSFESDSERVSWDLNTQQMNPGYPQNSPVIVYFAYTALVALKNSYEKINMAASITVEEISHFVVTLNTGEAPQFMYSHPTQNFFYLNSV